MNWNDSRVYMYAGLAVLGTLLAANAAPVSGWDWYRYFLSALYQGGLAIKAYQSEGPQPLRV